METTTQPNTCAVCGEVIDPTTQDYAAGYRREDFIPEAVPHKLVKPGAVAVRVHDECEFNNPDGDGRVYFTMFTHDDPRPWHTEAAGHIG
jgi:hypothetical protein